MHFLNANRSYWTVSIVCALVGLLPQCRLSLSQESQQTAGLVWIPCSNGISIHTTLERSPVCSLRRRRQAY